jgi:hypothetical protein
MWQMMSAKQHNQRVQPSNTADCGVRRNGLQLQRSRWGPGYCVKRMSCHAVPSMLYGLHRQLHRHHIVHSRHSIIIISAHLQLDADAPQAANW